MELFVHVVRRSFTACMSEIIALAKKLRLDFNEENKNNLEKVGDYTRERERNGLNEDNYPVLKALWEDPATQEIVTNHKQLLTTSHIDYFWEHVDRIIKPDYVPNEEDILRVRVRTAGAYSTVVFAEKNYFEFFDVGGQKPERSKWENLLQTNEFACILYFLATDEWDVNDEEREFNFTKMELSKTIFNEVVTSEHIGDHVPIILFLNRSDRFSERIQSNISFQSFKKSFPEYSGGQDEKAAMNFLRQKFMEGMEKRKGTIQHYVTNALDKNSMTPVWQAVKQVVMERALKDLI